MNMTSIHAPIITGHGIARAKERCSFKNRRTAEKNMALALTRGKGMEEFSSWERNFLRRQAGDSCRAIAYNNFCYLFDSNNLCVTVYPLPSWFGKKKRFNGKEKIRHYKKYCLESIQKEDLIPYRFEEVQVER